MKFCADTLIDNSPDPITSRQLSTTVMGSGTVTPRITNCYTADPEAFGASPGAAHNKLSFSSPEDFLESGSVLVGSPEQMIDKFGRYQAAFGHELSGRATEIPGMEADLNRESVERFVGDVNPVLRTTYPSRVWSS